jgi:enterochelin esterase-like enzyme
MGITPSPQPSPRVAALQQAIEAGDQSALDAFWQKIAAQEAPLVEPIADDDRRVLLTFLWRAAEPVDHVLVFGGPALGDMVSNRMLHLAGTDLWHLTYRVRNDLRTTYRLSPNDSLVPFEEVKDWKDWAMRVATWRPDPLNPRTFVFAKDEDEPNAFEQVVSVIELPDAPPQPWSDSRPGVPAGRVELHRMCSDILGNERRVWVYTPPGYTAGGEPYGLLLLFDGWACIHLLPVPTVLDNLLAESRIPPLVAVMPDSPDREARNRELPCHPPFADFLVRELLPWARARYHVTDDPARTIVGGASYGGLAAAFAGLRHPEVFGNVLSQSGSFWWKPDGDEEHEWLTRQFVDSPALPLRFYLDVGLLENTYDDGPSQRCANRHLRDVLRAKGYPVHYVEYNGGHDYVCWRGTLADGLLALVGSTF